MNPANVDKVEKEYMKSMVSCMNSLLCNGFETQFHAMENGLKSLTTEKTFQPDDVKIVNFYRFEGESDPGDSAILYAIETSDGEKGTLTDSYGHTNDSNVTKFIQRVTDITKVV